MFERFNENVRRALFFARYEASRAASHQISTQHVLLGMLREADTTLVDLCLSAGIDVRELRDEVRLRVRMGDGRPEAVVVPSLAHSREVS